nr:DUF4179 domain-containing protein [Clostridium pasteurianum]
MNCSLSFASTINNVPIVSSIAQALQFHYDKNMISAVNQSDSQNVNQTVSDNNISLTINSIVGDDKDKFILYTLKSSDKKIKNLLLNSFTITDSNNNIIVDSNGFRSQILPVTLMDQEGDFLSLNSSKDYKVIVSSLGDSIKDYADTGETYGSIEIISLNNTAIPDKLNLEVSSFTEAYNMTYSQKKYADFISKFNREPMNIKGNWNLSIKAAAKTEKPEEYNNIKFSANNTDLEIRYLKIYPTHIEANIKLGMDKTNNSQAWGIGTNHDGASHTDNYNRLPYLIDENGNKYMLSPSNFSYNHEDKSVKASFQSSYYRHPKHLYLVISRLNYSPGPPYTNITPVKIQIK